MRIVRGQTLILAGTTAVALLFLCLKILSVLILIVDVRYFRHVLHGLEFAVYPSIIAGIVGVFFATAGYPLRFRGSRRRAIRWGPRAFGMLLIAGAIAHDFIDIYWNVPVIIVVFNILIAAIALGLVMSFMLHLASLADCIPDRQLARRSRVLTVALSAYVILGVVVWFAILASGGRMDEILTRGKVSVATILTILFTGALLTLSLIWAQMWVYRKTVKQVIAASVSYETLFGDVPTEVALRN